MSEFKVGDKIKSWGSSIVVSEIETITSITKGGNYKTDKDRIYTPNGFQRGGSTYDRRCMRLATDRDIQDIINRDRRDFIVSKIRSAKAHKFPLETLEKIYALIKEAADE